MIHLVLGGARSGKSAFAEALLDPALLQPALVEPALVQPALVDAGATSGERIAYLATGRADPGDDDMATRIARHRDRRGTAWETIEVGAALAEHLGALAPERRTLVDALGTWVAAHPNLDADVAPVVAALRARTGVTVVVSDEVGLGVHPESAVGRRFRDVLGEVNQAVAAVADEVTLVVAGLPVVVRSTPPRVT